MLTKPQPGQVTCNNSLASGVLVVSQDQTQIVGIVNGTDQIDLRLFEGPPTRYESIEGDPHWVFGFDDEGVLAVAKDNQTDFTGSWSQP